jgi:hypothetical protein
LTSPGPASNTSPSDTASTIASARRGAALARLEAEIALASVFARFPDLALAVAPDELTPSRSFLSNGHTGLPVNRQ